MAKVLDVAKYFLLLNQRLNDSIKKEDDNEEENFFKTTPDPITHLKMQKLVYYAQGLHLTYFNRVLFEEEIQAWPHGPVVKELYNILNNQLKNHESSDLMLCFENIKEDDLSLNEEEREIIKITFNEYGQYSASALRNKTHKESPWLNAFEKKKSNPIEIKDIKDFFDKQRIEELDKLYKESEQYRCLFS